MDDDLEESRNGGDTAEPGAKRCCTLQTSGGTGSQNPAQRRRRRQPRKTPNANAVLANPESQQKKKRQQQISNRNRRMNPKFRYFCASEDCKESLPQEGKGFVTKEDARRHLKIHEAVNSVHNTRSSSPHGKGFVKSSRRKERTSSTIKSRRFGFRDLQARQFQ